MIEIYILGRWMLVCVCECEFSPQHQSPQERPPLDSEVEQLELN